MRGSVDNNSPGCNDFDKRTASENNKYTSDESKTTDSGSKNSIESATKESWTNQHDGTISSLHGSELVLTIPSHTRNSKKSKRAKDVTKFYRYEVKQHKKMVRILTVIAYAICVSMAAIVLSLYYVFLWDPGMTKYRALDVTDCDLFIQKLKLDANVRIVGEEKRAQYANKLRKNADEFVNCTLEKIKLQQEQAEMDKNETEECDPTEEVTPYALPLQPNSENHTSDMFRNQLTVGHPHPDSPRFKNRRAYYKKVSELERSKPDYDPSRVNFDLKREKAYKGDLINYDGNRHDNYRKEQTQEKGFTNKGMNTVYKILSRSGRRTTNDSEQVSTHANDKIRKYEKASYLSDQKFVDNVYDQSQYSEGLNSRKDETIYPSGSNHHIGVVYTGQDYASQSSADGTTLHIHSRGSQVGTWRADQGPLLDLLHRQQLVSDSTSGPTSSVYSQVIANHTSFSTVSSTGNNLTGEGDHPIQKPPTSESLKEVCKEGLQTTRESGGAANNHGESMRMQIMHFEDDVYIPSSDVDN